MRRLRGLNHFAIVAMCAATAVFATICYSSFSTATPGGGTSVYQNPSAPVEARVQDALSQLTLHDKILMLAGDSNVASPGFSTVPVARLGIPAINMTDGPLGVRWTIATAFPSGLALAAGFDPMGAQLESGAMADETLAAGRDMLLGPCVDIAREPFGGRNFESFGEDPFLTSQLTTGYVTGVQSHHVIASTKHFAMNDEEYHRMTLNVIADERTMQEIHLPAFHAAVEAGTWTVMAAYNKINGLYATENAPLLTKILKQDWGFKGFVESDWGATHSGVPAALAGLDLEMPSGLNFNSSLEKAVQSNQVPLADINDKVSRILRVIFASGLYDAKPTDRPDPSSIGSADHLSTARQVAENGIVLLKNDGGVLPVQASKIKNVAVIGAGAYYSRSGAGGSSMVSPTNLITPLAALKAKLPNANIQWAIGAPMDGDFDPIPSNFLTVELPSVAQQQQQPETAAQNGLKAEFFNNMTLSGSPILTRIDPTVNFDWAAGSPDPAVPVAKWSARWSGYITVPTSSDYDFEMRSDDGGRLFINDALVIDNWHDQSVTTLTYRLHLDAGKPVKIRMEYFQDGGAATAGLGVTAVDPAGDVQAAVDLASKADVVVLMAGLSAFYEGEGHDRDTTNIQSAMDLPAGQNDLIAAVVKANPNTIVIINAGNPVTMPWIANVKALMYGWYLGQEGGNAIADLILGTANPSGKLPISFPKSWKDSSAYGTFPSDPGKPDQLTYTEGLYVGYRHFDKHNVEPLFPFGFGLSYTKFDVKNLEMQTADSSSAHPAMHVSVDVTNTGSVAGAEVVQLYVGETAPKIDRPIRELKGFKKVFLQPGETQHVTMNLDASAFAYFDVSTHAWKVDPAQFKIQVGTSSRDLPLSGTVQLE